MCMALKIKQEGNNNTTLGGSRLKKSSWNELKAELRIDPELPSQPIPCDSPFILRSLRDLHVTFLYIQVPRYPVSCKSPPLPATNLDPDLNMVETWSLEEGAKRQGQEERSLARERQRHPEGQRNPMISSPFLHHHCCANMAVTSHAFSQDF